LQHAFLKTSELRTYHWRTTVLSLRKYILSDGQVTSDERIERVEFKVLWKANVKADARFHDVVLEETSFDNRQFRSPTPAEVQQFGLARYTTPYQA